MIKKSKMQLIFFSLIPVGIIILILSIRLVQNTFSGNIILEVPYSQKSADFEIPESGNYSIWHKGQYWSKAPLDEFRPVITNKTTGERPKLTSLLFRPNSNNGVTARMEIFRFSAPAGEYTLELAEGSSISGIENAFLKRFPAKMVDLDKYSIQIRQSQNLFKVLIGIILMALAGFCIIGGLVMGILIKSILKN